MMVTKNVTERAARHEMSPPPASAGRMLVLTTLAVMAGGTIATWLSRSSYETYPGFVHAVSRTLTAGRDGRIAAFLVEPGQVVTPGTPLVRVSDPELEAQREAHARDVATLKAELAQTHARVAVEVERRRQSIESEVFETKLKAAQYLKQQFSSRVENLAWQKMLENGGDLSQETGTLTPLNFEREDPESSRLRLLLQQEAAMNSVEVSEAQVELCIERLSALESRLNNLEGSIAEAFGIQVMETRLARAEDELKVLDQRIADLTISASVHGVVGVIRKQVGDQVTGEQPLFELLDEDQPFALLQISSAQQQDFAKGTELELRFPDGSKGRGIVEALPPHVAQLPQQSERLSAEDALLTVHVRPKGGLWPRLPFGSEIEIRRYH